VLPREFNQCIPPRAAQRLDQIEVVAPRPFKRFGRRVGVKSDSINLLLKGLDGFDQARISAKCEQRLVESRG